MTTNTESPKLRAALAAAALVESGMIVGLGSGSTAALMVRRIGERVEQEGLKIIAVATSVATADLARSLKIPSTSWTTSPPWISTSTAPTRSIPTFR